MSIFQSSLDSNNNLIFNTIMLHPLIKWAQRKDKIFLEVPLMDIKEEKIDLTSTHLKFHGLVGDKKYSFELQFFEEVDTEASKWNKTGFHLLFVIEKKNADAPFWPRMIKSTAKNQYIQVDWSKWVDEDEEEEDPNKGLGGFDPSQMQGFPGGGMGGMPPGMGGMMPGMGGMGDMGDEDDEEGNLDDLEKEEELEPKKEEPKQEEKPAETN